VRVSVFNSVINKQTITMKKVFIILAMLCIGARGFSQQDSTKSKRESHWHRWEEMHKAEWKNGIKWTAVNGMKISALANAPHHWGNNHVKPANLSTNWLIVDLGSRTIMIKQIIRALPLRHLLREVIQTGSI